MTEESFFDDVVGEPTSLVQTESTRQKDGREEKVTLIKGENQKLEFVESLVELGDDDLDVPKEADVMLEQGPMDNLDDTQLE